MSLIGLDIGTNGCKAALFSDAGELLAFEHREYPLLTPRPGWAELDGGTVLQSALECVRDLRSLEHGEPPGSIAVSSQGEAVTPLDSKGRILANAIVSLDTRAGHEVEQLEKSVGRKRIAQTTGQLPHTMYTLPHLMWTKKHRPGLFEKASSWRTFEDLVSTRLGADPLLDYSMAARTLAFDVRRKSWSEEMLDASGLAASIFSVPVPSGTIIGKVPADLAQSLNLPAGINLVAGGHDQPCSALGAGVLGQGKAALGIGTVECLTAAVTKPIDRRVTLETNIPCYNHVVADRFVVLAYVLTGGSLQRWFRDTFGREPLGLSENGDFYEGAIRSALRDKGPSGLLLLPHFAGSGTPWLDPASRGAIVGLDLSTDAADIYRALLEGTAFEMRENIELLHRAGIEIHEILATGGGARSPELLQLKADITSRSIVACEVTEASALGAAIIAGVGTGVYGSFESAVEAVVRYREKCEPRTERSPEYDRLFRRYRMLYTAVRSLMNEDAD